MSTPRRDSPGRTSRTRPVQKFGTAWAAFAAVLVLAAVSSAACAQSPATTARLASLVAADSLDLLDPDSLRRAVEAAEARRFRSEADSLEWESARRDAERSRGFRIVISLFDRRLWAIRGDDTLHVAEAGVGMDSTLVWDDEVWDFTTPRGRRTVLRKARNPVWIPPDWHYVEAANHHDLRLERLERGRPVTLSDGSRLMIRGDRVVHVDTTGKRTPVPLGDEIIYDGVLYMPPFSTRNRRIEGELGPYKLDLGEGYLIHGTPHERSVGRASTHGCIRLADADIEWLYRNVPNGTAVYIY